MIKRKTKDNVVPLHAGRITVTLSILTTALIEAEIKRQTEEEHRRERSWNERREEIDRAWKKFGLDPLPRMPRLKQAPQTPQEIIEHAVRMLYAPVDHPFEKASA